jgi:hypothetical protein
MSKSHGAFKIVRIFEFVPRRDEVHEYDLAVFESFSISRRRDGVFDSGGRLRVLILRKLQKPFKLPDRELERQHGESGRGLGENGGHDSSQSVWNHSRDSPYKGRNRAEIC